MKIENQTAVAAPLGVPAKEVSEYELNANSILEKMNVQFKATFLKHDFHFQDDDKRRDIFRCEFKRLNHNIKDGKFLRFSLKFGQSINDSTGDGENKPSAYDVVACLQKYQPENFEDFCNEYGYNDQPLSNYKKVKKIYDAVCNEWNDVNSFFTPEEIEQLQEVC